jgi:hypothetical protein
MPRGRPPKPTALHLIHGTWRKSRHGPRPDRTAPAGPSIWDTFLALPEIKTEAELPQEEREAAALDKMGWRRD